MALVTSRMNEVLDSWFQGSTFGSKFYIGLCTSKPHEDDGSLSANSEVPTTVSGKTSGYSRIEIACNNTNWNNANNGIVTNKVALRFPEAKENWTSSSSQVKYYAIFDSSTGGNAIFFGELSTYQDIPSGSVMEIPVDGLQIALENA